MSEKHTDPQIMEHNIRGVIDYWTTITQDDLTNFFNALRADAWDEGVAKGAAYGDTAISLNPMHANPYREANDD